MRRLLPLTLVLLLTGSALAEGRVTCSVTPRVAGCFYEQTVWTILELDVSIGADFQGSLSNFDYNHVAPYVSIAYYGSPWSVWMELFAPRLGNVPVIGRSDWFRLGFTWRFE